MSEFVGLAIPNIEGMRLLRYLKVIGGLFVFGVSLFFVGFFVIRSRKNRLLSSQIRQFDHHTQVLEQQLLLNTINKSSGKKKLVLFIEYLEKFVTTSPYTGVDELLCAHGFDSNDVRVCKHVLYADGHLPASIEQKIEDRCSHRFQH